MSVIVAVNRLNWPDIDFTVVRSEDRRLLESLRRYSYVPPRFSADSNAARGQRVTPFVFSSQTVPQCVCVRVRKRGVAVTQKALQRADSETQWTLCLCLIETLTHE